MSLSLDDLTGYVRRMIGSPDTTELPDATIQGFLTVDVLDWINRRRPGRAITSFETVTDQQDYDEKPANAYKVVSVWWLSSDLEYFSPSMRYEAGSMDVNSNLAGFSLLDNPALVESFYKKISAYQGAFGGEGYETEEGQIRLAPYPGADGDTVYFEYTYPRWSDILNVGAEHLVGCKYKAAALCLEWLMIRRGFIRSGKNFTSGGGANERDLALSYLERAESEIPLLTSMFYRG